MILFVSQYRDIFSRITCVSLNLYIYKHRTHVNMLTTLFFSMITKTTFAKIYKDKTMCPSDRHNYIQCPPVMSSFVYPNNKDVSNNKRLWQKTLAGYDNMTYIFLKSEAIFVTCITYVAFML